MKKILQILVAVIMTGPLAIASAAAGAPPAFGEANGVGLTPAMGWSSWSFLRQGPSSADIEAQA